MEIVERDIRVGINTARVYECGAGAPIFLMHGAGPGTSAKANFGKVLEPLAERYRIYATDMIGFGASSRKSEPPFFDYDLWLRQMQTVLDLIPPGPVGLLGHSIAATFAMRLAVGNSRVARVLLSCPMGTPLQPNDARERLWTFPRSRADLRRALETLLFDHSLISDALLDSRMQVLSAPGYAEYFDAMFGGDKQALVSPTILSAAELAKIRCPLSIIHGRDDRPFPYEETTAVLAPHFPQADIHLFARCGHGPASERTDSFVAVAGQFFG
jgi:2-hydroxymuconate-semialdehyde hydrolase